MPGQVDDPSFIELIEEEPRDLVCAVWGYSTDEDGSLDSDAFIRLAIALADVEDVNLLREFNANGDVVEAVTGRRLTFPENMVRRFDSLDWLTDCRS